MFSRVSPVAKEIAGSILFLILWTRHSKKWEGVFKSLGNWSF